ncbi:hypothetical protein L6452_18056 [Arctium lappa]|uniref:Uncharacterized protein n=1 Tax=Arctium lappa TaxID=4217 RepID=A0ACB9C5A7_ARCLA|nr:hypothetical protein L6452_18056 [Arctium lappa]
MIVPLGSQDYQIVEACNQGVCCSLFLQLSELLLSCPLRSLLEHEHLQMLLGEPLSQDSLMLALSMSLYPFEAAMERGKGRIPMMIDQSAIHYNTALGCGERTEGGKSERERKGSWGGGWGFKGASKTCTSSKKKGNS